MPKPFKLTPQQAAQQKRDLDKKDLLVHNASQAMNGVLRDAINQVYAHYQKTGKYKEPDLSGMFAVTKDFYRQVITAAVDSCEAQKPKKRLAAKLPEGELPEGPRALDRVLKNRRYWQKIMRRARALTERQKKNYLDNLRKQFKEVLPHLESADNPLSPKQVKQKLAEAWRAPQARIETVFRTESTKYFCDAQINYFKDTDQVIGYIFDSVRDSSRTPICQCRHGLVLPKDSKYLDTMRPPLHFSCRSHLVPLSDTPENQKMLKDPARDPAKRQLIPVMPGFGKG